MVSFSDVVGGETGPLLDYYSVYIFLFLVFGIIYYVGLFRLLYKVAQQMFILLFMFCIGALWWILVSKHFSYMQDASVTSEVGKHAKECILSASIGGDCSVTGKSADSDTTLLKEIVNEETLIGPLSEIILITGTTLMILSWLYRQLPIDLIPDCIPCIGKYDNMIAGIWLFIGLCITIIGIYLQWYYVNTPNSTKLIYNYFNNFTDNFRSFLKLPTEKQIDRMNNFSKDVLVSLIKFSRMVQQSFFEIFQRLQTSFEKKEL